MIEQLLHDMLNAQRDIEILTKKYKGRDIDNVTLAIIRKKKSLQYWIDYIIEKQR